MVCDLYDGHLRRALEIQPGTPTTREYEKVIARTDIEAVLVATSDHWHAPIAIAAMRAGKDVYCEKPMAHTIPEALEMAKVSRETGKRDSSRQPEPQHDQYPKSQAVDRQRRHRQRVHGAVFHLSCQRHWSLALSGSAGRFARNHRLDQVPGQRAETPVRRRSASSSSATGGTTAPASRATSTCICSRACTTSSAFNIREVPWLRAASTNGRAIATCPTFTIRSTITASLSHKSAPTSCPTGKAAKSFVSWATREPWI